MSHPHSPHARLLLPCGAATDGLGRRRGPGHGGGTGQPGPAGIQPGWFAERRGAGRGGAERAHAQRRAGPVPVASAAQDAARQKLQQSIDNLGTAAQAIALQRLQEQARQGRRDVGVVVADGLGKDGLKVDENPLTRGWINAREAIQSQAADGRLQVSIEQTADQAILNWESFNIGGNTTLNFLQNPDWAVLNRVTIRRRGPARSWAS